MTERKTPDPERAAASGLEMTENVMTAAAEEPNTTIGWVVRIRGLLLWRLIAQRNMHWFLGSKPLTG